MLLFFCLSSLLFYWTCEEIRGRLGLGFVVCVFFKVRSHYIKKPIFAKVPNLASFSFLSQKSIYPLSDFSQFQCRMGTFAPRGQGFIYCDVVSILKDLPPLTSPVHSTSMILRRNPEKKNCVKWMQGVRAIGRNQDRVVVSYVRNSGSGYPAFCL